MAEINGANGNGRWPQLVAVLTVVTAGLFIIVGLVTDAITMKMIVDLVKEFGVPGIVFVLWWLSNKSHEKTLKLYREDMQAIKQMYKNNVHLVESYDLLSKDLKDVIIMNTQAVTRLCDDVRNNNFCPAVREARGGEK